MSETTQYYFVWFGVNIAKKSLDLSIMQVLNQVKKCFL